MQLGMVGLGRMGSNLVRRVLPAGHECVVFDVDAGRVSGLEMEGATGSSSLDELVEKLQTPRAVWVVVPAGRIAEQAVHDLGERMAPGDVIIDGGNSYYRDDIARAATLNEKGIHYLDVGTSGGVWGLDRGYCLMIGGEAEVVERLRPLFAAIAPGVEAAPRTPGRTGEATGPELGYLHCGQAGAGHFVKMVHNGIEYGVMAAYAEGLSILKNANAGTMEREADAETAPAGASRVLPVRDRHRIGSRGVATRQRFGLRRGSLDGDSRGRGERPGTGAAHRAVLSLRLPRPGPLCGPDALGDAQAVRWTRGEAHSVSPSIHHSGVHDSDDAAGQPAPGDPARLLVRHPLPPVGSLTGSR
jgi:6-phosphogluconate dehydrogenase (decarboxylating)